MFSRLPNSVEVLLFAALALICAAVVLASPKHDSALFFTSVPLFLVGAMAGFRRSERKAARSSEAETTAETADGPA